MGPLPLLRPDLSVSDDPLIGQVISDRYRIDSLLGEGAMGRVYLGEHVLMRKRVAIKFMHRELTCVPEVVQRFEREALAAAHIEHPHVASCTDFGRLDDGTVFLILEYVQGVSLAAAIDTGPMEASRAVDIALQIASALEAAHARDIVHRDLKPENILLLSTAEQGDFVKVLDFGIAKVPVTTDGANNPITQVGMVYGTPEYMAPEQALGQEVDCRADLYALGVIVYEMLAGVRPYEGNAASLLGKQLSQPIPLIRERAGVKVPAGVETLVRQLLARDASARTQTAQLAVRKLEILTEALVASQTLEDPERRRLLSTHLEDESGLYDMRAAVRDAAKGHRSRRMPVLLVAGLCVALGGAAGAVGLPYLLGNADGAADESFETAANQAPEVPEPDAQGADDTLEKDIESARSKGIDALNFLAEKYPAEGQIWAVLAVERARMGQHEDAVTAARTALELDPKLNEHPALRGALFRAAQSQGASSAAFRLLEGPMGEAGADVIYDLSRVSGVRPWVKSEATSFLASAEGHKLASKELRLVLALGAAKSCEDVLDVVRQAPAVGESRALPLLRKLGSTKGCGQEEQEDCYPCLRGSGELQKAISTVEARVLAAEKTKPETSPR